MRSFKGLAVPDAAQTRVVRVSAKRAKRVTTIDDTLDEKVKLSYTCLLDLSCDKTSHVGKTASRYYVGFEQQIWSW
jgi:hypothetical protein